MQLDGDGFVARGITVQYGGLRANDDVNVAVETGRIVGLIGPNGAGKTTFIDAVTGFAPSTGFVGVGGTDVSSLPPHRRAQRGLARTWQSVELSDDQSVADNVLLGAHPLTIRSALGDIVRPSRRSGVVTAAETALELLGLGTYAARTPGELSLGQQKLVGIARALAAEPTVVLLDEPAAGLDTHESEVLGRHLRTAAASGVGLLLVDHDMGLVLDVCDEIHVLDFGRIIASGTPAMIRGDRRVVAAYLGDAEPVR